MVKKKRSTFKGKKVGRGKPKGKPPAALRRRRSPRAVAPPPREVGLLDAIGEVMAVCEELGQEMRDWADNMPENKQGGDKHSEVEGAAETLENVDDPVEPEGMSFLNEIKVTIQDPTPVRRPRSRATRLGDATDILNDVIQKLEEFDDDTQPEDKAGTASELKDALENIESELQGVDFPGMYG